MGLINLVSLGRDYRGMAKEGRGEQFFESVRTMLSDGSWKSDEFSFRGLIENFIEGGREICESMDPRRGGVSDGMYFSKLLEADAVATSAFTNISGQVFYNEILTGFQMEIFVATALIPTRSTALSGEKIAGVTDLGDRVAVVDEAQPYPMVGVGEDWIQTAETIKRGNIVPVTREAIFFDRTGDLLEKCRKVGEFLGVNKEKRAIDCIIDENTTAHRYNRKNDGAIATYGNNSGTHDFDNLQADNDLADWSDVDNAEILLNAVTDPNTGEPVIVQATHMFVSRARDKVARRVLNTTEIRETTNSNTVSIVNGNMLEQAYQLVTSRFFAPRMGTDTSWYLGDPKTAFRYMENFPLTTSQAPPNSEMEFTHDIAVRFKTSERGTYATVEPRAMVKNTVS